MSPLAEKFESFFSTLFDQVWKFNANRMAKKHMVLIVNSERITAEKKVCLSMKGFAEKKMANIHSPV